MKKCILLLVLAFALLASCGKPEATKDTEPTQGDTALQDTQADPFEGSADAGADTGAASENEPQETVLTFSLLMDTYHGSFRRRIDLFEQAHPGITVKMSTQSDGLKYREQIITNLMAGMGPDIFINYAGLFSDISSNGSLVDFYTLFDNDESFSRDDYYMNVIDAYAEDGALYRFPLNFNYQVVTINKDMPADIVSKFYGLETITYLDWVKLYKEADVADRYRMDVYSRAVAREMIKREVAGYVDFGKKEVNLTMPSFIDALNEIKSVLSRTDMDISGALGFGMMRHRTGSTFYDSCAFLVPTHMYEMQYPLDMENDPFGHPIPIVNKHGELEIGISWMGYNEVFSISGNAKNKELAWTFIKFLASDESVIAYDGAGDFYFPEEGDSSPPLYGLITNNFFPTNRHLFEFSVKAWLPTLFNISGNMRTVYDMDYNFGSSSIDDLIANKDAHIQAIYELYDKWNNMPIAPLHTTKLSPLSDVISDYVRIKAKTAEEAANEMQSILRLSLNE